MLAVIYLVAGRNLLVLKELKSWYWIYTWICFNSFMIYSNTSSKTSSNSFSQKMLGDVSRGTVRLKLNNVLKMVSVDKTPFTALSSTLLPMEMKLLSNCIDQRNFLECSNYWKLCFKWPYQELLQIKLKANKQVSWQQTGAVLYRWGNAQFYKTFQR